MGFFMEFSLLGRLAFVASLVAALGVVYGLWHHSIYKAGEVACEARYTAAAAAQAADAQEQIATEKVKYAQIDQDLQKSAGYAHPASPLVSSIISRMPSPHHGGK